MPYSYRVTTDGATKYFLVDDKGPREVTKEEFDKRPLHHNVVNFGNVNVLDGYPVPIPADAIVAQIPSLTSIPRHVAVPFWTEFLSWYNGLESMLRREQTPDTEIQQRLDAEYAKACERLAERARVSGA